eukprot:6194880-Pleurochrysis_carterae.AAC.1
MSPRDATICLHRRLHVGASRLRQLPKLTADAPASLAAGRFHGCPACAEANSPKLSHPHELSQPSYAGRLIHADITGPFVRTRFGGFQYLLVLVDDHSRFKAAYPMRSKADVPFYVHKFLASFAALLNQGEREPKRLVGTLHSDNAGEFLSTRFADFLS